MKALFSESTVYAFGQQILLY